MRLIMIRYDPEEGAQRFVIDNELEKVVREKAAHVIKEEWNPESGEFSVMMDYFEYEYPLPLKKEQYELFKNFNMRKEGKVVVVRVPYFVIMFPKYPYEGAPVVVYLITPFFEDRVDELMEFAKQVSSGINEMPEESEGQLE
ncbi:hypothetical protein IPA_02660 [Ignicoccus pacificus DSM 13166]|uniref:Uncharacterized protein n=1 Tax=Ignicoccus pacificus DSM 13166 TaxID=940294 RepID=A0A977PJX5_9CREN|nr:hypothetical protein IPA_02660 [Ignicoccus pacificus DSM 13166]